jgi:signal peptidase II
MTTGRTGGEGDDLGQAAQSAPAAAGHAGEAAPADSADRRPRWTPFLLVAGTVLILDQLTKAWLVGMLAPRESVQVIGDWVRLVHHRNTGALFGLFADQALLFGIVSIGVAAAIVAYHARSPRSAYLSITLGLLLGGALGNLVDRLRLGHVVDFVDIGIGDLRFYTFNVADAAISTSLLLLIASALLPSLAAARDGRADG